MDNMVVGRYIRELRRSKDLTTVDLAEKIGISQPKISRLENGLQDFTIELLNKICEALEISLSEIFLNLEGKKESVSHDKEIDKKQVVVDEGVSDEKIALVISSLEKDQKTALYTFLISMVRE